MTSTDAFVDDIRTASRRLVRELGFLDKTLAGTDLSASAVHAILEIGLTPGLSAKELAITLKLEKSTISRLLKSLESRGEITQTRSAEDARSRRLSLTDNGWRTHRSINQFGDKQVRAALSCLQNKEASAIASALANYADALASAKSLTIASERRYDIVEGYQTGMIGDIAALHARTHGPVIGMGPTFESLVANAMAEFMPRIGNPVNNSWSLLENGQVMGSITIDGEDLGHNTAHLRWFILAQRLRGKGLGRALLQKALEHCREHAFDAIHLWTLKGLDAAGRLYVQQGFKLAEEYVGDQWGKAVVEQKFVLHQP